MHVCTHACDIDEERIACDLSTLKNSVWRGTQCTVKVNKKSVYVLNKVGTIRSAANKMM